LLYWRKATHHIPIFCSEGALVYGLLPIKNVLILVLTRRDIYTIIRTRKQTNVREQMFCLRQTNS